jgi:hypothetical protein
MSAKVGSSKWVVLLSLALGAGVAILASAFSGYSWYTRQQWNSTALRASFDHVEVEPTHSLVFWYAVENKTGADYEVLQTSEASLVVKFTNRHWPAPDHRFIQLASRIFVPARTTVLVPIHFGQLDRRAVEEAGGVNSLTLVSRSYPSLDGFALYDRKNRCRIDFPRSW